MLCILVMLVYKLLEHILIFVLCICQECCSRAAELLEMDAELVEAEFLEKLPPDKSEKDEDKKEEEMQEVIGYLNFKKLLWNKSDKDKKEDDKRVGGVWRMIGNVLKYENISNRVRRIWSMVDSRMASVLAIAILLAIALYMYN